MTCWSLQYKYLYLLIFLESELLPYCITPNKQELKIAITHCSKTLLFSYQINIKKKKASKYVEKTLTLKAIWCGWFTDIPQGWGQVPVQQSTNQICVINNNNKLQPALHNQSVLPLPLSAHLLHKPSDETHFRGCGSKRTLIIQCPSPTPTGQCFTNFISALPHHTTSEPATSALLLPNDFSPKVGDFSSRDFSLVPQYTVSGFKTPRVAVQVVLPGI